MLLAYCNISVPLAIVKVNETNNFVVSLAVCFKLHYLFNSEHVSLVYFNDKGCHVFSIHLIIRSGISVSQFVMVTYLYHLCNFH